MCNDSNDEKPNATRLSEDELAASLAMIDRSMAQFEAGEGMSVEEARRRSREMLIESCR